MKTQLPKIVVILGPTATGKSDLAVTIAKKWNGEVISADSRQVYRGLDIGAGKITKKEMRGIPHHLIDVLDPTLVYTVEDFRRDGEQAINDVLSRGKLPIICGGTGFYIDALVYGEQFPDVPPNPPLRAILAQKTCEELMNEVQRLDPRRAKSLDPQNKVRIIRAIEIIRALGVVPRMKQKTKYETLFIGLTADKETLRERIHKRLVRRMKKDAMVKEVAKLHKKGLPWKRLHDLGLEYRYAALLLQEKISKEEMMEQLENEIARFSKRQMVWFKRNNKIKWFPLDKLSKISRLIKDFLN
jgi:tRNA dimethylallyltransferase